MLGILLYLGLILCALYWQRRLSSYAGGLWPLLLGTLAAFALVFPEHYLAGLFDHWGLPFAIPLVAPLCEEALKLALLLYLYRPERDERFFCLSGLLLGLGFASAENLQYILRYGLASITVRLFGSSVLHVALGILVALKISRPENGQKKRIFATAALWHGGYNLALQQGFLAALVLMLLMLHTGWQLWRGPA